MVEPASAKEQMGRILALEARDLNEASQLMSKHLAVRAGPFEIHPVADLSERAAESGQRHSTTNQTRT